MENNRLIENPTNRCRTLIARGQIALQNGDFVLLRRTVDEMSYLRHMVQDSLKGFYNQEYNSLKSKLPNR